MSVRRVMGSESEFGLTSPGLTSSAHSYLSALLVSAFADSEQERAESEGRPGFLPAGVWDYSAERPLEDSRGFSLSREQADESQLTDSPPVLDAVGVAMSGEESKETSGKQSKTPLASRGREELLTNLVLTNGSRFYVDHAHPEYSSPEVMTPRELLTWDEAGDLIAMRAAGEVFRASGIRVDLFKNNTDSKRSSYGTHENYLVDRGVEFERLAREITTFFVTRQIYCGAGRLGRGVIESNIAPGFQISARADFFEERVGLETTFRRPIVNARDEPHADEKRYRRLHVIIGDANISHTATLLRFGTTSLVLGLIERGQCPVLDLEDPVQALQDLSHDIPLEGASTAEMLEKSMKRPLSLENGDPKDAISMQRIYLEACRQEFSGADEETDEILALWGQTLEKLERDPLALAEEIDWIAKFRLLDALRRRDALCWDDPRLMALDLQYALLDQEKGLGRRMLARGALKSRVGSQEILAATSQAPGSTRAFVRGLAVKDYAQYLMSVSWDRLNAVDPAYSAPQVITLPDPCFPNEQSFQKLFGGAKPSPQDFFAALRGNFLLPELQGERAREKQNNTEKGRMS